MQQICVKCLDKCSVCASVNTCEKCLDGFYLANPKSCVGQKKLKAQLIKTYSSTIYILSFSHNWLELFNKITDIMDIEIEGVAKEKYNYVTLVDEYSTFINIIFEFETTIKNNAIMNIKINYTDDPNDQFLLQNKNFSIKMNPFCPLPTTFFESIKFEKKFKYKK